MRADWLAQKGSKRRQPGQSERAALEAALIDEVVELGYRESTATGVCRRAGIDGEGFTRHFADLDDAYCLTLEACLSEVFERISTAVEAEETWCDQVRAAAYAIFDYLDEDRRRGRFMMVEVLFAGERALLLRDGAMEALTDLIDRGRVGPSEPDTLSRATAEAIVGSIFNQVRGVLERDDPASEELVPQLMYSVVQPYLGSEEACRELAAARPVEARPW